MTEQTRQLARATKIARELEELILDGSLSMGERLPSERLLATRLNASRSMIREAIKELQGRGIVETRHGKGSFVAGIIDGPERDNALNRVYSDHPKMLYDLLEVREVLEGQATGLAATRATSKDIHRIRKAYNAMNEAEGANSTREYMAGLDFEFHQSIYEASHNPILIHTLQNLMQLMQDSVLVSVDNLYHRANAKSQIDDYHRLILNAIVDNHTRRAENAAMDHVRDIRDRIRDVEKEEERLVRAQAFLVTK